MAQDHARDGFYLDILDRPALDLRKIAHLRLGELYVVYSFGRDAGDEVDDCRIGQPEALGRPFVEFLRQFAHGGITACFNIGKDVFYRVADIRVIFARLGFTGAFFEMFGHDLSCLV